MQDYAARRSPQRLAVGIAIVLALHLLLLWAIQSGMSREVTRKIQVVADVLLLSPQPKAPDPAPPPPPPPQSQPLPTRSSAAAPVPQVETPAAIPPSANSVTVVAGTPAPVAPATMPAPAAPALPAPPAPPAVSPVPRSEPVRTAAVVNSAQCEKPDYPSASRRLEEEGTVHLRFLVGVDGKVIQAEVEKSSGFKRLDDAARAGLAKCQFRPATVDGKPEQAWAQMRYTWRLE